MLNIVASRILVHSISLMQLARSELLLYNLRLFAISTHFCALASYIFYVCAFLSNIFLTKECNKKHNIIINVITVCR